jgi:hypothetical protein
MMEKDVILMEEFFQVYGLRRSLSGSCPFFKANTLWSG